MVDRTNIVVVGYPKSGNTWMSRLVAEVVRCPVRGFWGNAAHADVAIEGLDRQSPYDVFKAHHPLQRLREIGVVHDLIYVVRDPRDVACSGAHYFSAVRYNEVHGTSVDSHEAMVRTIVAGSSFTHCQIPWSRHVEQYLAIAPCIVKYEELLLHPVRELGRVLGTLGISRTDDEMLAAIERQRFARVKARDASADDHKRLTHLRQGIAGCYSSELSQEQCDRIVGACGGQMHRLGYQV